MHFEVKLESFRYKTFDILSFKNSNFIKNQLGQQDDS